MESIGLSDFLKSVGSAVHSLNTICIGLHGVETGQYQKPDDLTVSWETADSVASARKSRAFAVKAAFVFVEEEMLQYLKYVAKHPSVSTAVKSALGSDNSAAERIEELSKLVPPKEPYWEPLVCLMIHWRNRFVHLSSKAELKHHQKKILGEYKEKIRKNHAAIDIEKTLEHFKSNNVTLKDASTLISVAIRFARNIDENLYLAASNRESVKFHIEYMDLVDEYLKSVRTNGDETRDRRTRRFFKTRMPYVHESLVSSLVESPIKFRVDNT